MTTTTPAAQAAPAKKKRLTTSAMIASFADAGQNIAGRTTDDIEGQTR